MSMSKKDFIDLADRVRFHNQLAEIPGTHDHFTPDQISFLAEFCKSQNPAFMRDRWLDYIAGKCGKNGGKVAA